MDFPDNLLDVLTGFTPELYAELGPDYFLQNQHFKIAFKSVKSSDEEECRSVGFQKFYDWRPIMSVLLGTFTEVFTGTKLSLEDLKGALWQDLFCWCFKYEAFGLVLSLTERGYQKYFIEGSTYYRNNWERSFSSPYDPELLFKRITSQFERQVRKKYFSLFPSLEFTVAPGRSPRHSILILRLKSRTSMKIKFEVTKLSLDASLTEKAANVVRQNIQDKVDLPELGLPHSLSPLFQYLQREKEWLETFHETIEDDDNHNNNDQSEKSTAASVQ